ncbi:MAG: acetyltransferase [Nitrospinota bacterium]|nr:acetyltransferase [Nitrospinota bacterium]
MNSLLILGAGGHGKVVADTAASSGLWQKIAFLDDRYPAIKSVIDWPVVGRLEDTQKILPAYSGFVVAIGDNILRAQLLKRYLDKGFKSPHIVHPKSYVSPSAEMGPGCVVFAQGVVNPGVKMEMGGIINTGASVDHDCQLGEGVHICPGARLAGEVHIGSHTMLATGASVIPRIHIGNNVMVAAGSVVISNIGNNCTVAGVPARVVRADD